MADLKQIAETLVNLTVKEVSELATILKDEYGIEPAAAAPVATTPIKAIASTTVLAPAPSMSYTNNVSVPEALVVQMLVVASKLPRTKDAVVPAAAAMVVPAAPVIVLITPDTSMVSPVVPADVPLTVFEL